MAEDAATLRVALHSITVRRVDASPEDDFKTWAQVVLLPADGVPSASLWFATGEDAALACTSVTNGSEGAAYNYVRLSKPIALTEEAVSEVVSSTVLVREGGLRR